MRDLSLAELGEMILGLQQQVADLQREQHEHGAVTQIILAGLGGGTHATIAQAAAIRTAIERRNVSERTIERRIHDQKYHLEQIPGTQSYGIPLEQLHAGWTPVEQLRAARAKNRKAQV